MLKLLTKMISEDYAKSYCKDDISLIENYDKAIADKTQVWDCHHRRETIYSRSGLIEIGEYYNRPACELIFLTPLEHHRLHHLGKHLSAEARKKISESNKGENNPMFGTHHSVEARKKMSEAKIGKHHSVEARKKMSEARKGKHLSEETRTKLSETIKCKHWYNNGVKSIRAKTCPEGFVPGRLKLLDDVPNGFIKGMKANS